MTATTGPRPAAERFAAAWTTRKVSVGMLVLAFAAVLALLLALPGQTVTTKYIDDLFLYLDSAHRIVSGQVPNRDFHTALGPLGHYIPAAGYWISGSLGAAMPVGMALTTLVLAPAIAHVAASRLHVAIALPFSAFVLLILAVPINLGEGVTALSFTRFYNRIGWAALATLLVMYLLPRHVRPGQDRLDALCAAGLALVLLYTKATYGIAALAFLGFLLFDPRQRRWAALALGLIAATGLVVEAFWQSSAAHVADLLRAWRVDGGLRGSWGQIVDHVLGNLADFVLLGLLAGFAVWRSRSIRDLVFYGFCAIAGFLIINQNYQAWGIVALHAGAAVAAETILRRSAPAAPLPRERWSLAAGTTLLFLALVLPTIVHGALALGLHAGVAIARAGDPVAAGNLDRVRLAQLWTWSDYDTAAAYLQKVRDGAGALAGLEEEPGGILVLDLANPFPSTLGAAPARGDAAGLLFGRTMDSSHAPRPDELLADVRIVMEPKLDPPPEGSDDRPTTALRDLYGPTIAAEFELVRETEHWRIHRRRVATGGVGCAFGCTGATGQLVAQGVP